MLNSIALPLNVLEYLTILYNLHVKMITIFLDENHVLLKFEWSEILSEEE